MRPFNIEKDLIEINCWLLGRHLDPLEEEDIPKLGQIVPNIACGFLVTTDTRTCFLEAFISNKEVDIQERSRALTKIAKWGIYMAKILGYNRILAITEKESLLAIAKESGFEFKDIKLSYLDIYKD